MAEGMSGGHGQKQWHQRLVLVDLEVNAVADETGV
jgi:hypothetical protein